MGIRDWFGRRRTDSQSKDARITLPAPPTEADIEASLEALRTMMRQGNAPGVVTTRVERIATTIHNTLPRLRQMGLGSLDAYSVMATATDYLPEAVGGYLRLPRDWADTRPIDGYKTSLMVLIEQLELLDSTMDKIFDAANRSDAQALVAHGRFLEAKFGHSSDLDTTGPLPTPDEPPRTESISEPISEPISGPLPGPAAAPRSSLDL